MGSVKLVLPDTTLYNAVLLAEKLRRSIEGHIMGLINIGTVVTANFGVASLENKRDAAVFCEKLMHGCMKQNKKERTPLFRVLFRALGTVILLQRTNRENIPKQPQWLNREEFSFRSKFFPASEH